MSSEAISCLACRQKDANRRRDRGELTSGSKVDMVQNDVTAIPDNAEQHRQ
jgi:hypothetical protein